MEAHELPHTSIFLSTSPRDPTLGNSSKELFSAPQEERVFAFSPPAETATINALANGDGKMSVLHDFRSSPISDNPRSVAKAAEMDRYRVFPDSNHNCFAATSKLHHDVPAWHCATKSILSFEVQGMHVQTTSSGTCMSAVQDELSASSNTLDLRHHSAVRHSCCPISRRNVNPECWNATPTHSEKPAVYATPGPTFVHSRPSVKSPTKDTSSPGAIAFSGRDLDHGSFNLSNTRESVFPTDEDSTLSRQDPSLAFFEECSPPCVFDSQSPVNNALLHCDSCSALSGFDSRYQRGLGVNTGGHPRAIEHLDFPLALNDSISMSYNPSSTLDVSRCATNSYRGRTFGMHAMVRVETI